MDRLSMSKRITGIIFGLIYLIAGIFIMNNPAAALITLSISLGWVLLAAGIILVIFSITQHYDFMGHTTSLIEGILASLLGLMFLFGNKINNATVLSYLLIFWIIIDSAVRLQFARYIPRTGIKITVIILDLVVLGYCIFMLFNPSIATSFLVFVSGVSFIGTGISKLIRNL